MTTDPTVMIVDDHPMWRDGVARDLAEHGLRVVATADGPASALRIAPTVRPDVILMDLHFDGDDRTGADVTSVLASVVPDARVLVLSASGEHADVLAAVKAGAVGYLLKSASVTDLLDAVARTTSGQPVFSPGLAGLVLGEYRRIEPEAHSPRLTARETEVLRFVATGLTARAIADRLGISHRTVENHVQSTLRTLQLHNRVELTRYAVEHGIAE